MHQDQAIRLENGLASEEVRTLLQHYGPNEIAEKQESRVFSFIKRKNRDTSLFSFYFLL
jgi:hypothetical protein